MTRTQWLRCAALIAELWPHRPLPPESLSTWYDLLADIEGEQVAVAIRGHALDTAGEWPPSLSQIRARCQPTPRAWEAALADLKAGRTDHDPALAQVAAWYGGWPVIGQYPITRWDEPTFRAQFRDSYGAAQRQVSAGRIEALASTPSPSLPRGGTPVPVGELTEKR